MKCKTGRTQQMVSTLALRFFLADEGITNRVTAADLRSYRGAWLEAGPTLRRRYRAKARDAARAVIELQRWGGA